MNKSLSSRGKARNGTVFGSSSARRIEENVVLADPCSPDSTIMSRMALTWRVNSLTQVKP